MQLWFEIVVIVLLVAIAIIVFVAAVTHEAPETSLITDLLARQSRDMATMISLQRQMDARALTRVYDGEMIRRMFTDGVHLNPDPAKKPLSDTDVKKILSEARLTFVEAPKNAGK